jgi:hypothetical protein
MRNLALLTTVLLSSSMLAANAAAQTDSHSPRCSPLGQRLGLCETIGVSASAAGAASGALDLLSKDYLIVPIEQTAGVFPSHLVIGPADLDDASVAVLLKRSYRVGKTVAIVGATADEAGRFQRLLRQAEGPNCRPATGQTTISLYGLQRSRFRFPPQNSSYCLVNLDLRHPAKDRRWLRERFGLTPPQPAAGKGSATRKSPFGFAGAAADEPTQFLTDLADQTHCSNKESFADGAVEVDAYVYAMRNFTDTGCSSCQDEGADYYIVQDNISFSKSSSNVTMFELDSPQPLGVTAGSGYLTPGSYNLLFTDPATTTTSESSYSNGSSVTVSASVGIDADGNPDVTASGSVTTSQSMTYSVPATTIVNKSNLPKAEPTWTFTPQNLPIGTNFDVNPTWTWFVPRDAYPGSPNFGGIGYGGITFFNYAYLMNSTQIFGALIQDCFVTWPFSAWTVSPPLLQSLGSGSTKIDGGVFTITGQFLYPSSVVAVLIGGTPVPLSTNVDLVDDTEIDVTVPAGYAPGAYEVQVNTQFNGQTRFSNTLSLTLTN